VLAVITISFDPVLRLSETSSVRYETIVLAVVLLLGLVATAWIGARAPDAATDEDGPGLRIDDLVFISVGAVPGLFVGGRIGYVLDHLDFYAANPQAIFDLAQGGLTLTLAVPLGILTAAMIARLLGAPVGRWLHVAALPMLFVLAAGKLAGVLGATGQGAASDLDWATAYSGPGPWGSLAAELPAHPSQVYEAIAVAVAVLVLAVASRHRSIARPTGAALFLALGLWAVARFVVAFTWRDSVTIGPLRVDQLLLVVVAAGAIAGVIERARSTRSGVIEPARTDLDARPA
jgi:phosphatidylglycerol:prolipoprotein diacylglycerol transferase